MTARPVEQSPRLVIRPPGRLNLDFRELFAERELLYFLALRTIKVRYKQALAGPAWAVFQPLLTMLLFTVIFGKLAKLPSNGLPYPIFYYTGLVLWMYFANAVSQGANSIVDNQQLVSKVYFPRAYLPLAAPTAGLLDLGVATVLIFPLLGLYGRSPSATTPLALIGVAVAVLASSGLALLLGALNARFRDVRFTVPFFLQAWLFASPVAYAQSLIPEEWRTLYSLNPMAGSIEWFRWSLTGQGAPPAASLGLSAITAIILLAAGAYYFQRTEGTLADIV